MTLSFSSSALAPQLRRILGVAKRVVGRAPSPIGAKIHNTARSIRNRRRDQQREQAGNDGAYFDDVVKQAIAEGNRR